MSPNFFPAVEIWRLPRAAFAASLREMALDGEHGNEGIALWLGKRDGALVTITRVVCLRGDDVVREPAHLSVGADTLNEVADLAIDNGVTFVGQIHSHGRHFGVDLSLTDRRYGVAVPHFLSVVAPDYALRPDTTLSECGVHVFEAGAGYRRLGAAESARRLVLTDDDDVTVMTVGAAAP